MGFECVDGLNNVSCIPVFAATETTNPARTTPIATPHVIPTLISPVPLMSDNTSSQHDRESESDSSDNGGM